MTMRVLINIMPAVMPRARVSIRLSVYWKTNQETIHTSALLVFHRDADTTPVSGFWLIIVGTTFIAVQPLRKALVLKRAWEFWPIFAGMTAIMQMITVRVFLLLQKQKTLSALGCYLTIRETAIFSAIRYEKICYYIERMGGFY